MINDGGPAFPNMHDSGAVSLRDYFAAKAMAGFIQYQKHWDDKTHPESIKITARYSYEMADAMILERNKQTN